VAGGYGYVIGYLEDDDQVVDAAEADDEQPIALCRLAYLGADDDWGFAPARAAGCAGRPHPDRWTRRRWSASWSAGWQSARMASAGAAFYSESCCLSNSMITEGGAPALPRPSAPAHHSYSRRSTPPLIDYAMALPARRRTIMANPDIPKSRKSPEHRPKSGASQPKSLTVYEPVQYGSRIPRD
jgi:hypothetical protein